MFIAEPERYAPQYGGYCSLGVALGHAAVNLDPDAWRIINGKLYLVYAPTYVAELDGPNRDAALQEADQRWPAVAAAQRPLEEH
jgi:hypothetical protein